MDDSSGGFSHSDPVLSSGHEPATLIRIARNTTFVVHEFY